MERDPPPIQLSPSAELSPSSPKPSPRPHNSTPVSNEQIRFLLRDRIAQVRRSFASYRRCTNLFFDTYDDVHAAELLDAMESSVIKDRAQLCQVCAIAAVSSLFDRQELPEELGDQFYEAARFLRGACSIDAPLAGMKVCLLIGLYTFWRKARTALEHFEYGISLVRRLESDPRHARLLASTSAQREVFKTQRSLMFGKAWLQTTLGYLAHDKTLDHVSRDAFPPFEEDTAYDDMIATEIANITILSAHAFRKLLDAAQPSACLKEVEAVNVDLKDWYQQLPAGARADRLSTYEGRFTIAIYYVHLQHLGAVMLVHRRILSIFSSAEERAHLSDGERAQLTTALNEGILAAKQAARALFLIIEEGRDLQHCWMIIFNAYVCGALLLHFVSQLQIHGYPERRWGPSIMLAQNAISVLQFCQERDPVARAFDNTLRSFLGNLEKPSTPSFIIGPGQLRIPAWDLQEDMRQTYRDDMADLLFSDRLRHTCLGEVREDLHQLLCQIFEATPSNGTLEEWGRREEQPSWRALLPRKRRREGRNGDGY